MKKRILSWALVLCMVLALLPGAALAADEPGDPSLHHKHTVVTDAAIEATCTKPGLTEGSHCSVCNEVLAAQEVIPALGHRHAEDATPIAHKDATCTEDGFNTYRCSVCGLPYDETLPQGHTVAEWEITKAPNCTEAGEETGYCAACHQAVTRTLPANGHTFDDFPPVVTNEATCTETGTQQRFCTVCKQTVEEEIPMLAHSYGAWTVTEEATCTEVGEETRACADCGKTETREIPKVDYEEVVDAAVAPTCTETGKTEGKHCSVCGAILVAQEEVPALGHTEVVVEAVEPTCTETGLTEGKYCSVCNEVLVEQEEVPATGHEFGEWETTKEATCTEAGEETRVCASCGETETREVAMLEHTIVVDAAVEATCTKSGLTEGKHCSVCNGVLVEQEVVPATGTHQHSENAAPIGHKDATCTEDGYDVYRCEVCGLAYQEAIQASHSVEKWTVTRKATCTEAGSHTGYCSVCHQIIVEVIPAQGHHFDDNYEPVVTKKATCTEDGEQVRYCTVCGLNITESIPALGHDYDAVVTEPTCTEAGYTTHTCSRCGDSYVDDEVAALGHAFGEWAVTKEATCTEAGEETRTCAVCNEVETHEIEALGHTVEAWEQTKAPTCTDAGEESGVCTVCEETVTRELPALGHTEVIDAAVEPTCTTTGLTEGKHCSVCNEVLVAQEVIPALGHTEVIDAAVEPTCTTTGLTEGKHCSVCNEVLVAQEVLPALGHKWDDGVVTTAPTATKDGVKTFTCTVCGETKIEVIPATGAAVDVSKFTDLPAESNWAYPGIVYCLENGLMVGVSDTEFAPNIATTRAMVVTILWNLEGNPAPKGESSFTDLTQNWYKQAVAWAAENDVVAGRDAAHFDPNASITREEMAAILCRYAENIKGVDVSKSANLSVFPDSANVSNYAKASLSWAVAEGLINGNKIDGVVYLDPKGTATRAQVATILTAFCERILA